MVYSCVIIVMVSVCREKLVKEYESLQERMKQGNLLSPTEQQMYVHTNISIPLHTYLPLLYPLPPLSSTPISPSLFSSFLLFSSLSLTPSSLPPSSPYLSLPLLFIPYLLPPSPSFTHSPYSLVLSPALPLATTHSVSPISSSPCYSLFSSMFRLVVMNEQIQVLEATIDFKNDSISSKKISMNSILADSLDHNQLPFSDSSAPFSMLQGKLGGLESGELCRLLEVYFQKVVELCLEKEERKRVGQELEVKLEEEREGKRKAEAALGQVRLEGERMLTTQQMVSREQCVSCRMRNMFLKTFLQNKAMLLLYLNWPIYLLPHQLPPPPPS